MKKNELNLTNEIFCDLTEVDLEERFEFKVTCGAGFVYKACEKCLEFSCSQGYNKF